jgi:hypothetical protein
VKHFWALMVLPIIDLIGATHLCQIFWLPIRLFWKIINGMQRVISIIFILLISVIAARGQSHDLHILPVIVQNGDTIPYIQLPESEIFAYKVFKNDRELRRYDRLVRNVRIVYPYAHMAGEKLIEYETILLQAESDKDRRRIMKDLEDELHREYGEELKKLTISQGRILIKLIDRQTGESSFDLVKDLRGSFRAFFYQSFARIFGLNLKDSYDPEIEDRNIEIIVRMIESGMI